MIELLRPEYPARIGRIDGLVLIDFVGLLPEVHGDPNEDVLNAVDAAAQYDRVALLIRVRDSRPPPAESRAKIFERLQEIQDKLACVAIALEGAGFRAVAFRSFVSAARLVGVVRVPVEIRSDIEAATALLEDNYVLDTAQRESITEFFAAAAERADTN
jgi:hypothetical protein